MNLARKLIQLPVSLYPSLFGPVMQGAGGEVMLQLALCFFHTHTVTHTRTHTHTDKLHVDDNATVDDLIIAANARGNKIIKAHFDARHMAYGRGVAWGAWLAVMTRTCSE